MLDEKTMTDLAAFAQKNTGANGEIAIICDHCDMETVPANSDDGRDVRRCPKCCAGFVVSSR